MSLRFGDVRVPATFHGTARLLDPTEPLPPPEPARYDDLPGVFHAKLDITFDLLVGLGYGPVDPSHPAYPRYLAASAASAASEPAPASPDPVGGIDRHSPYAIVFPFQTMVPVTAAMALEYGLVAPGRATSGHGRDAAPPRPSGAGWHRRPIMPGPARAEPRRRSATSRRFSTSWTIRSGTAPAALPARTRSRHWDGPSGRTIRPARRRRR